MLCIHDSFQTLRGIFAHHGCNSGICYSKQKLQWPPIDQATPAHGCWGRQGLKSIATDSSTARSHYLLIIFYCHSAVVLAAQRIKGILLMLGAVAEINTVPQKLETSCQNQEETTNQIVTL